MKILILLFISFTLSFQTVAQNQGCKNFGLYYEAHRQNKKGNIDKADSLFYEVFSSGFGDLSHTYNTLSWAFREKREKLIPVLLKHGCLKGESYYELQSYLSQNGQQNHFLSEEDYLVWRKTYESGLDTLMIKELLDMESKDQYVRSSEDLFKSPYRALVDNTNAFRLKQLIAYNRGKFPSYAQIGKDGYDALCLLLVHQNIDVISDILPVLIDAIQNNEFYDHHAVLYQIDRNIEGNPFVFEYEPSTKSLVKTKPNVEIPGYGFTQYYGSLHVFDPKSQKVYRIPNFPEVDKTKKQALFDALCYPDPNPLNDHVRNVDINTFLNIFDLNQKK